VSGSPIYVYTSPPPSEYISSLDWSFQLTGGTVTEISYGINTQFVPTTQSLPTPISFSSTSSVLTTTQIMAFGQNGLFTSYSYSSLPRSGGGGFTFGGVNSFVDPIVKTLYNLATARDGASLAASSGNPVAPTPPAGTQLDAFLAAAEVDAWGAAAENYKRNTSTELTLIGIMLTNLQSAYNLYSGSPPSGSYPDQTNYPGLTYGAISGALLSYGMTP
jgi:hypothetical protein